MTSLSQNSCLFSSPSRITVQTAEHGTKSLLLSLSIPHFSQPRPFS
jgi:hypothetical protein